MFRMELMTRSDRREEPAADNPAESPRERLIAAGVEIFGTYGFEGATTRMLAAEAGVNLAAIPYYYGGKEGLYHAVVAQIARRAGDHLLPAVDGIRSAVDGEAPGRDEVLDRLAALLGTFIQLTHGDEARRWGRIIIREQMQPTGAFDVLYEHLIRPVHSACSAAVGRLTGRPEDADETVIRTHAVMGQVLVFLSARETILRRLGRDALGPADAEEIRGIIEAGLRSMFERNSE